MLDLRNLKPIAFYGYTSRVVKTLFEFDEEDAEKSVSVADLKDDIEKIFDTLDKKHVVTYSQRGFPIATTQKDNKTVVELRDKTTNVHLFIGRYDRTYSIGFDVWTENPQNLVNLIGVDIKF